MKKSVFEDIFTFLQILLFFLICIFLIITLFIKEFQIINNILLSLLLFVMGINNHIRYKRKYMTPVYFIMAIVVFVSIFI